MRRKLWGRLVPPFPSLKQAGGSPVSRGMQNWLLHRGRAELSLCDRGPLEEGFTRLAGDSRTVAELADDLLEQLKLP